MAEEKENGDGSPEQADADSALEAGSQEQPNTAEVTVESVGDAGQIFPDLTNTGASPTEGTGDLSMIMDIPVQLTVELGRTRIPIKHILQLAQGSVVELDALAGEPMDVLVNGFLIAQGEVVVVNEKFGVRLTDIVTPSERVRRLHRS
ncbi:MAG: flagellar motor switch protein FliN [Burkholderiaceae bacterium]